VPLAFPSHQGLIAPLWRKWPERFDALALSIGAAMPDVVDGARALVRGHLGQGIGHSLIGLFAQCWPAGVAILFIAKPIARRWMRSSSLRIEVASILIGAFSHLVFDFISHDKFLWAYPWKEIDFFPRWWTAHLFELKMPFYDQPYPIGVHFFVWCFLSVLGGVLFFTKRP